MKLTYEKLPYQEEAVKAVIDTLSGYDDTANSIDFDNLDDNVRVTLAENRQSLPDENYLEPFPQFNIEMETGTGKTMVYLKTIMELHKRFVEAKFIIVVPSKAIKAGVEDSLAKMKNYLSDVHNTDKYAYFVYDSKQISQLQTFSSSNFDIMVTTIQAFNSNNNVINQEYSEGFFGGKPLDMIRDSAPIVIIDEPQSVDGAEAGKMAIASLNPKLVLRYSATHKDKQYPLLYQFGPVQAYNGDYVKKIETLGVEVDTSGNLPFVELKEVKSVRGILQAKVIAYVESDEEFIKKTITLKNNDLLSKKAKNSRYAELGKVSRLNSFDGFIEFENGYRIEVGNLEEESNIWLQAQMEYLVREHLEKELRLQSQGIKVLSLIFIDSVEKYRVYFEETIANGEYAQLFEQIYARVLQSDEKYKSLNDYVVPVSEVHDGYFAQDKKGKLKNSTGKESADDETAFQTIMQNKEGLLTQYVPSKSETDTKAAKLRFVFSHSALKEGWDNPNVFQILTITTPKNELTRRQKIGRGLRISVNQEGKRVYGSHNVVTIYANETFEEFAEGLQTEYLAAGLLTDKIAADFFSGILVDTTPETQTLLDDNFVEQEVEVETEDRVKNTVEVTSKDSAQFVQVLEEVGAVKSDGKIAPRKMQSLSKPEVKQEIVKKAVEKGIEPQVAEALAAHTITIFVTPQPENKREKQKVELTDRNNEYFKALWDRIAYKVNYRVKFEETDLIEMLVTGTNSLATLEFSKMSVVQTKARIKMLETKLESEVVKKRQDSLEWQDLPIVDVTKQIADKVGLTRRAVIEMIQKTAEIDNEFINKIKQNPAVFVRRAINKIQMNQKLLLNRSLVYVQTGELWSENDLQPFESAKQKLWQVPDAGFVKTLFEQIAVDSQEERDFAQELILEEKIKYFLKLPHWFKIPTPFGNYNPDWAILAESNGSERLYFVVDTKSTLERGELRDSEKARLDAGKQAYVQSGVKFKSVKVIGNLDL
ncbi:DEAD/DEAH box helicase family protein [Lactococcus garvieae]|uniref:restriction endonuclease n=1 Tax=Lactococcus garvieae TaxID=1363 RepID=UPI00324FB203